MVVTGGADACITPYVFGGFVALNAMSKRNHEPEKASKPFDKDRDGFVMGEGAGIMMLEELDHAKARGAKIYGEIIGYGLSGDAYHITAPAEDGDGAYRCMQAALGNADIEPADIDYVNAHGTSTPMGDEIELGAVAPGALNNVGQTPVTPAYCRFEQRLSDIVEFELEVSGV